MHDIGELNDLYRRAESLDREVFAEMRSNILLVAGDHYQKRADRYFSQIRDNRDLSDFQKLRLTKNHTQKITRHYETHILNYASGVTLKPQREGEMQDQKAAEICQSVWRDARHRWRLDEHDIESVADYVRIGEVCTKIWWDPNIGELKGYEPLTDEFGDVLVDEFGQPLPDEDKPVMEGGFEFQRLFPFNLLRDPTAKNFRESQFLIYRQLVDMKEAKRRYRDQPEKLKLLTDEKGEDFIIFDAQKGGYDRATSQVMFKEYYWKPSEKYPNGYYEITTSAGILEEGELPFGIWPFVWQGFDEHATSARARSIVKQIRPYQAEINRAASAMAMHQITVGDDKVLYQSGTKLAPGALLPGVRGISYQGAEPKILAGRDGSQFVPYIDMKIKELYNVVDLYELDQEKEGQFDPLSLLYRSSKQRQKFHYHTKKFERFRQDECELFLKLAREYYDDDMVITAAGRNEIVNIAEFKNTSPLNYLVVVEPQDDTLETKFGRQVSMMHLLQYAGKNLSRDDIGMVMRNMPFANTEETFGEFTIDYDNSKNIMLALERGEMPDINEEDKPQYMIKKLTHRIKQPDFKFLHPQIQQMYMQVRQQYHQLFTQQQQAAQQAKNEYIPQDGPMIACDMYVENKEDPSKAPKRARIPHSALNWLVKQLEFQAGSLGKLEAMNGADQAAIAQMMQTGQQQPPGMPAGMNMGMPPVSAVPNQGGMFQ
jgi:hypothetical protein